MEHDDKYYRRLGEIWHFSFNTFVYVAMAVIVTLSITSWINHSDLGLRYSQSRTLISTVMVALFVVLIRIPFLLDKLRKIDCGEEAPKPAKATPPPYAEQLEHARREGLIDQDNRLLRPRSDFVRFCVDYMYFYPYGRAEWKVLDNVLKDAEGEPVSYDKLAQTFQDIKTREGI